MPLQGRLSTSCMACVAGSLEYQQIPEYAHPICNSLSGVSSSTGSKTLYLAYGRACFGVIPQTLQKFTLNGMKQA